MSLMRYLEVRRHAQRTKSGESLSEEGFETAERIGQTLPDFDLVVTSELSWAIATAVAMGYSIDAKRLTSSSLSSFSYACAFNFKSTEKPIAIAVSYAQLNFEVTTKSN